MLISITAGIASPGPSTDHLQPRPGLKYNEPSGHSLWEGHNWNVSTYCLSS